MRSCSRGSEPLVRSSGRGRSSTRAGSRRKKGLRNGPELSGQRTSGLEAPPPRRRERDPARLAAHGPQPQRRHPADPAARGGAGGRRPARPSAPRPASLVADRGYDHDKYRRLLRDRGIKPLIARRQTAHGSRLARVRWVVERTFAWLHNLKRLLVRYERRADMHEALLALGCCLVCFRRLRNSI